jgi:Fe-S cluster assembly protein SufD
MTGALLNAAFISRAQRARERARGSSEERLREGALARCRQIGLPTTRLEDWRFTNLAPLASIPFESPGRNGLLEGPRAELPSGVSLGPLAPAELLELARLASEEHPFVALNTALFEAGLALRVPEGTVVETPIRLAHRSEGPGEGAWSVHPRTRIELGPRSRATLFEEYRGGEAGSWLTNPVTEVRLGEGAELVHVRVTCHAKGVHHVGVSHAELGPGSRYHHLSLVLGGGLTRVDLSTDLGAPGAEASLDGVFLAGGEAHVDHHTSLLHRAPHTTSRQLYRGVIGGQAQGVFNGKIVVARDAQKISAEQANHNLLLGPRARIHTKPELQIYADDVRCTHGATSGRLDENALFYLRARGIPEAEARRLLVSAFVQAVLARLPAPAIAGELGPLLEASLAEVERPEGGAR